VVVVVGMLSVNYNVTVWLCTGLSLCHGDTHNKFGEGVMV
jgi:hypothetical protein